MGCATVAVVKLCAAFLKGLQAKNAPRDRTDKSARKTEVAQNTTEVAQNTTKSEKTLSESNCNPLLILFVFLYRSHMKGKNKKEAGKKLYVLCRCVGAMYMQTMIMTINMCYITRNLREYPAVLAKCIRTQTHIVLILYMALDAKRGWSGLRWAFGSLSLPERKALLLSPNTLIVSSSSQVLFRHEHFMGPKVEVFHCQYSVATWCRSYDSVEFDLRMRSH